MRPPPEPPTDSARQSEHPPAILNGNANPDHYRSRLARVNRLMEDSIEDGGKIPFNYEAAIKGIMAEAKMAGIGEDELSDRRSAGDKLADALDRYVGTPEAVWEDVDAELEAVLAAMDNADALTIEHLKGRVRKEEERSFAKKLEALAQRIRKVLMLRQRARKELPQSRGDTLQNHAIRAAHLLRFMLYVGRSNIPSDQPGGTVYAVGHHHATIAWNIYEARNSIHVGYDPRDMVPMFGETTRCKGAVIVCPPGHGKPLAVTTPILMADGLYRNLGDIKVGDRVISHTGTPRNVSEVHKQGELRAVRIVTESGREVLSALDHPFMTPEGWVKAGDLVAGQALALVPNVQCEERPALVDECRLAGYFVGDGNTTAGTTSENCRISSAESEVQQEIIRCADSMGFKVCCKPTISKAAEMLFSTKSAMPREWTRAIGISGHSAHTKRVPEFVFRAGPRGIAAFLAAYFECDGCVNQKGKARYDCCVEFYSVNHDLLVDTQRLLLRLGIHSTIRMKNGRYGGENHKSWRLSFSSRDEVAKFLERVPVVGSKRARLEEWAPSRMRFDAEFLSDRVKSVDPAGTCECRCLTVDEDHTFLANDLVVHNTEVACHYAAREICFNPETQAVMLHAVAEKAEGNLRYVAACFDRSNAVGRRCMALFPVELAMSTSKKMRVKLKRPMNQATLEAYGVMAGRLGVNTTLQIWDDIVPQSDISEEATRKRRFERISGTWMTRQRGEKTFVLCIGTLWHYDDAVMRLIEKARSTEGGRKNPIGFLTSIQSCGGPNDTPKFRPLWPEGVSQDKLRQAYAMNPAVYSAAYQSNPRTEASRIVRRLRFYDPMTESHAEFRKRSVNYLSLDPSGVNRAGNDKAGLVYAAAGEIGMFSADGQSYESREVLRIVDAREFNASQTDLVEFTRGYALNNSTHYVLAEQQGQAAIVDIFREFYGVDVIPMNPGNKNKEIRLRRVAGMIDQSQAEVGGPNAVVEFPGVVVARTDDGRPVLGPDPAFKWLFDQILDFGVSAGDHALDAVTQLCYHLMPQLRPGSGSVTEQVRHTVALSVDGRAKKLAMELHDRDRNKTAADQDAEWYAGRQRDY